MLTEVQSFKWWAYSFGTTPMEAWRSRTEQDSVFNGLNCQVPTMGSSFA